MFIKKVFLLIFLAISQLTTAQTQKGTHIIGQYQYEYSGYCVSMGDSNNLTIGEYGANRVRIYKWNGSAWVQKGSNLYGTSSNDYFGYSVSMPDQNTVAVGAPYVVFLSDTTGYVRIFKWNSNAWVQKGSDIIGEANGDHFGVSVSMPDSNTVAIGAKDNDGNGSNSGHVRIYRWNGSAWVQKGSDIDGEAAGDQSGGSVSMPDSNTVAIGAYHNDGNGSNSGHVRVYSWNGSAWVQKGSDIDGEHVDDGSGQAVSMPDSNTVAIGAPGNDDNGSDCGSVRVYKWNGSAWVQKGSDIDGIQEDNSGSSVSMSDSNTVAIGSPNNDNNGSNSGCARIYKWSGTTWVQIGIDINGEADGDQSGRSVSMPDSKTIAIGAPLHDVGYYSFAGSSRVYTISESDNSPLPVIFLSFNILKEEGSVIGLKWQTASELNSNYFIIEKSIDGLNYKEIGRINAAGNSSVIKNYRFYDSYKTEKIIYYRIKEIDYDGAYIYSGVRVIYLSGKKEINTYPNPTFRFLHLTNVSGDVIISDIIGNVINDKVRIEHNGGELIIDMDLLEKGIYIIKTGDGNISKVIKK